MTGRAVTDVLLALAVFLLMEPLTAATHRLVMHRRGMVWHASHHRPPAGPFEANDLFPLVFASLTIAVLVFAVYRPGPQWLIPVGVGVTAYGVAYLLVHEVVIHRRVPGLPIPAWMLRPLRTAHAVHHRYGRAPYGFLCPITPKALRATSPATTATLRGVDTRARRVKTS